MLIKNTKVLDALLLWIIFEVCVDNAKFEPLHAIKLILNKLKIAFLATYSLFGQMFASGLPPAMILNNRVASDPGNKSNLFAHYFSSVFCDSHVPIPTFDFASDDSLSSIKVNASDVQRKPEELDSSKSADPDNIPPKVLKLCVPVVAVHLAILFNALLSTGIFPNVLKQGFVVPIYKSGGRSCVTNYRPIVIQSTLAKVFESHVLDHLIYYLKKYILCNQHGFLRGRSTITNLLSFLEYIVSAFIDSSQVDCIYLDYSKAFDKVHHGLLVAKLAGCGICGRLLSWLACYLEDRELIVKCGGAYSVPFRVLSGVPQGSHLGPLLFNVFVNDIVRVLTANCLMFADDLKIFATVTSVSDQVLRSPTVSH